MGTGNWGRNLVRVFSTLDGVALRWIVDPDDTALGKAHLVAPHANRAKHISSAMDHVQLVAVCTPAHHHYQHVQALLKHGKNVLVEKPFTMNTGDALSLADASTSTLMVGHQLLYHPAFTKLQSLISRGALGKLRFVKTERTGAMDLNREPGVLWSYGPHDVSMILALTDEEPTEVLATGRMLGTNAETAVEAHVHLVFPSGVRTETSLSTLRSKRTRRLIAICDQGTLVFDDREPGGRLFLLDGPPENLSTQEIQIGNGEPLSLECKHFVDCVRCGKIPVTGSEHAVTVTRIIHTGADRMAANCGKSISSSY
jgi:UDP-2-acetamido-3-amino-2,3-dideoxy-glucuronate N-acetyltransferase